MTENIIGLIVLAIGLIAAAIFARTRVRVVGQITMRRSLPDVRTATPMPPVKPPRPMTRYTNLSGREAFDASVFKLADREVRRSMNGRAQSWASSLLAPELEPAGGSALVDIDEARQNHWSSLLGDLEGAGLSIHTTDGRVINARLVNTGGTDDTNTISH